MRWTKLIKPISLHEEDQRKEKLFNIIIVSNIILALTAFLITACNYIANPRTRHVNSVESVSIALLVFIGLYILSKKGRYKIASYIFLIVYIIFSLFGSYQWGVDVPQILLIYTFIIVMAGVTLGPRVAFMTSIVIISSLLILSHLQISKAIEINYYWKKGDLYYWDVIVIGISYIVIAVVSWISSKELEKSLIRAQKSEKALRKERDLLEVKVEERTKELQKAQLEKMINLYRFADFGKLTSGLIHDLVNPLTSISANLDHLASKNIKEVNNVIRTAMQGAERMESYINAARKQIQNQTVYKNFSPLEEIKLVQQIFNYKSVQKGIVLRIKGKSSIKIKGNPIKFSQIISNLISNAIDSYEHTKTVKKYVDISIDRSEDSIVVSIKDYGAGISSKNLKNIFNPFFTTKNSYKGTGIGLTIVKDSIEKDFKGNISVESKEKHGTTFTIHFPIMKN